MSKETFLGNDQESGDAESLLAILKESLRRGLIKREGYKKVSRAIGKSIRDGEFALSCLQGLLVEGQYVRISREFSPEAQAAIEAEGKRIICPIKALSLKQLLDNPGLKEKIGPVQNLKELRAITPPETEIAIDPRELAIPESELNYEKSVGYFENLLRQHSRDLQRRYGREDIAVVLFPGLASALVQADIFFQGTTGKALIADFKGDRPFYLKTADQTKAPLVACVGRGRPEYPITVDDWFSGVNKYLRVPSGLVPIEPLLFD